MNSTSRTQRGRAPKRLPVPYDFPETVDPYVAVGRPVEPSERASKRASERGAEPSPAEPEQVEMSAMRPLLWLFVPLVLVVLYGALSSWLGI